MPSTQTAAGERRNDRTLSPHTVSQEPPKLKTTLKTPPKQATNPLQFVKVGPCSLYRTAQEQLQKVQEVKKIKQEIRDDPEDWQSNLDNWKSSRRKRQEHIIERVVEVKKLELEEHDRQRRRSKTFSEMMEERGQRGRKLSISLAMYNEEDANDLSDLGIGTSSGKSSVSGDTHDDTHSVLSDRECDLEKNYSDADNNGHENDNSGNRQKNGNDERGENESRVCNSNNNCFNNTARQSSLRPTCVSKREPKELMKNVYSKNNNNSNRTNKQEYLPETTNTASLSEFQECTYKSTVQDYVHHGSQNMEDISRDSVCEFDAKSDNANTNFSFSFFEGNCLIQAEQQQQQQQEQPVVKIDIVKRREIFEKASRENLQDKKINSSGKLDLPCNISIKERLSNLERQKNDIEDKPAVSSQSKCLSDFPVEHESKLRGLPSEELEGVKPLKERLCSLEKLVDCREQTNVPLNISLDQNASEFCTASIKDRFMAIDVNCYELDKRATNSFHNQPTSKEENVTSSERTFSPDYEFQESLTIFHPNLAALEANSSNEADTLERDKTFEAFDQDQWQPQEQKQQNQQKQELQPKQQHYPKDEKKQQQQKFQNIQHSTSSCSSEIRDEIIREGSEIHSSNISCPVNQRVELSEQKSVKSCEQFGNTEEKSKSVENAEAVKRSSTIVNGGEGKALAYSMESRSNDLVLTERGTADFSCSSSALGESLLLPKSPSASTNANPSRILDPSSSHSRPVVYQSPRVPPRRSAPEIPSGPLGEIAGKSLISSEICARSPSKIPTPLSRRQAANCPQSPPRQKAIGSSSPFKLSEIPVPVKASCSPSTSSLKMQPPTDTRRHTVLEHCEKVLVPRGQPQVTPFISVECNTERSTDYDHTNVKHATPQQALVD